jgi:hypothetical protein
MIPDPPDGAAVVFNPPPGWSTPMGFDPRRGHLADPTWPSPPEGWAFWVADSSAGPERAALPSVALPPTKEQAGKERRRLVIILGVVGLIMGGAIFLAVNTPEPVPDVGSCWSGNGDWLNEVPCGPEADYVAVKQATTPQGCRFSSGGYLEFGDAFLCLEPY